VELGRAKRKSILPHGDENSGLDAFDWKKSGGKSVAIFRIRNRSVNQGSKDGGRSLEFEVNNCTI
jgi:hypothetical protein